MRMLLVLSCTLVLSFAVFALVLSFALEAIFVLLSFAFVAFALVSTFALKSISTFALVCTHAAHLCPCPFLRP